MKRQLHEDHWRIRQFRCLNGQIMGLNVDVLLLGGASPSGLGVTIDVFAAANRLEPANPPFNVTLRSPKGGPITLRHGLHAATEPFTKPGEAVTRSPDAVLVVGLGAALPAEIDDRLARPDARATIAWLNTITTSNREQDPPVLGGCTATFVLGAAGLLDRRRCTTTWWLAPDLARRHPTAEIGPDETVAIDRGVWTAGASFAQTDLVVAYMESVIGSDASRNVTRHLLHHKRPSQGMHRLPELAGTNDFALQAVEAHIVANLAEPITLDDLARVACLGRRTLDRRIRSTTGLSPMRLVQRHRAAHAIRLIEGTELSLDDIATRVGLSDAASLYRLLMRTTGQTPTRFRRQA
jgi:transcriptional regulator GlxA family with amidase domain